MLFRIINFEILDSIINFFKVSSFMWENSSIALKILNILALLGLITMAFCILAIYIRIFFFKSKLSVLKKYTKNRPSGHQTVFRFEIEQRVDKKLEKIEKKKKMSFHYNKPLNKIEEDSLEDFEDQISQDMGIDDIGLKTLERRLERTTIFDETKGVRDTKREKFSEGSVYKHSEKVSLKDALGEGNLGRNKAFKGSWASWKDAENQSTNTSNKDKSLSIDIKKIKHKVVLENIPHSLINTPRDRKLRPMTEVKKFSSSTLISTNKFSLSDVPIANVTQLNSPPPEPMPFNFVEPEEETKSMNLRMRDRTLMVQTLKIPDRKFMNSPPPPLDPMFASPRMPDSGRTANTNDPLAP